MVVRGATLLAATLAAAVAIGAGTAGAKPLYGVVPQDGALPTAADLELMPKAGIGGVRLMASWATVEQVEGLYDWDVLDAMVRESTNRGIAPLFFLYGTPDWAAQRDGYQCAGVTCHVYAPRSPETRGAFAAFARAAVERYGPGGDFWEAPVDTSAPEPAPPADEPVDGGTLGGVECPPLIPICEPEEPPPPPPSDPPLPGEPPCGCEQPSPIRAWQVWNEQNSPKYFAPKVDVPRFAALLQAAGTEIKSTDPGAEVIVGGMWGPRSAAKSVLPVKRYLKQLYQVPGIEGSFDAIGLHPYSSSVAKSLNQINVARKQVKRSGDREVGTWITELGWAAGGPRKNPYVKGLAGQARLLSRALRAYARRSRRYRLEAVYWYSWRDKKGGNAICDWCGNSGLRTKKGAAKPAWKAFARVAR